MTYTPRLAKSFFKTLQKDLDDTIGDLNMHFAEQEDVLIEAKKALRRIAEAAAQAGETRNGRQ